MEKEIDSLATAKGNYFNYQMFNKIDTQELDKLVMKWYPDTYIKFLESMSIKKKQANPN